MKKVLCVSDYFLPGYLGGGPIRTIDNMRKQLVGSISISVFTRDRDLGSDKPYANIQTDQWQDTPEGPIYYASPASFGPRGLMQVLRQRDFDIIYLNSFFSPSASIFPYLVLRMLAHKPHIIVAPRGEFSSGAFAIRRYKKQSFVAVASLLGLYRDVFWHASTRMEAGDILQVFPEAKDRVYVAPDPVVSSSDNEMPPNLYKKSGHLKIVFISRISPKKNLDELIRLLSTISASVELDIFGPIEDAVYWQLCEKGIALLPGNIQVAIHGPISPELVSSTFACYDLFVFPTHGENFGHVIYEALRVGTPVLISDQTPWAPDASGGVDVIPLSDVDSWRAAIENAAAADNDQYKLRRVAAFEYARQYSSMSVTKDENLHMFQSVALDDSGSSSPNS